MKRELIRITFVGDIMCERPLLKAYFMNKGYDFRPVFEATKKLFNEFIVFKYSIGNSLISKLFISFFQYYTKTESFSLVIIHKSA